MNPQSEVYAAELLYSNTLNKKINAERHDPVTSTRPSYSEDFGFKPQPEGCPSLQTTCHAVQMAGHHMLVCWS
jgi:hypothetical protein